MPQSIRANASSPSFQVLNPSRFVIRKYFRDKPTHPTCSFRLKILRGEMQAAAGGQRRTYGKPMLTRSSPVVPVKSHFDQVRGTGKLNLVKTPYFMHYGWI